MESEKNNSNNVNHKKTYSLLNTFDLKMIAVITMTIDHIGAVLLPQYLFLRIIGRISFPIYCFLSVNGFFHSHNVKRYIIRLAVFAVVSEPFFDRAFNGGWYNAQFQNVFFTLLIGMIMLAAIEFLRKNILTDAIIINYVLEGIVVIFACGLAYFLSTDYSFYGILMIYWFYLWRFNKGILGLFQAYTNMNLIGGTQAFATIALIPIFLYNGEKGPSGYKWWFYIYYPAHLLVIYIIKAAI